MITTLLLQDSTHNKFCVHTHVTELPKVAKKPITVQFFGSPRKMPQAKLSNWIRERMPLEKMKDESVGEIVLTNEDCIYEGLTTNFFVVRNQTVETANNGVLEGTMQRVVIEACKNLGIKWQYRHPRLSEAHTWTEAFVTNVVKIITPVHSALVPVSSKGNTITTLQNKNDDNGSNDGKALMNLRSENTVNNDDFSIQETPITTRKYIWKRIILYKPFATKSGNLKQPSKSKKDLDFTSRLRMFVENEFGSVT